PGALPRRARARAQRRARARRAADRSRAALAGDRGLDQLLQAARPRARRAHLAEYPELPGAPGRIPREGRGRARPARAAAPAPANPPELGRDRRVSVLRVRRDRELSTVLDPALGRAPHVAQGDRLRDLAVPDGDDRATALLGSRDVDRHT